jgi:hypothetical protein
MVGGLLYSMIGESESGPENGLTWLVYEECCCLESIGLGDLREWVIFEDALSICILWCICIKSFLVVERMFNCHKSSLEKEDRAVLGPDEPKRPKDSRMILPS